MHKSLQVLFDALHYQLLIRLESILSYVEKRAYSMYNKLRLLQGRVISRRIGLYFKQINITESLSMSYNETIGHWHIHNLNNPAIKKLFITKETSNVSKRKRDRSKVGNNNKSRKATADTNATSKNKRTSQKPKRNK